MYSRQEQFEEGVRRLATEDDMNRGLWLTPEMVTLHRTLVENYLNGARLIKTDLAAPIEDGTIGYIRDPIRTTVMLRALERALKRRREEKKGVLRVAEGGFGSGFFVAAAAALDKNTEIIGFEIEKTRVEFARILVESLGYSNRVALEERDLAQKPVEEPFDVVIAEHVSAGLLKENAAEIPRSLKTELDFYIPYGVRPLIVDGIKIRALFSDTTPLSRAGPGMIDSTGPLTYCYGKPVKLGDPNDPDEFDVEAHMSLAPGEQKPIWLGNDVAWASPKLDPEGTCYESTEKGLAGRSPYTMLSQPTLMRPDEVWAGYRFVENGTDHPMEARFQVKYPFGFLYHTRRDQEGRKRAGKIKPLTPGLRQGWVKWEDKQVVIFDPSVIPELRRLMDEVLASIPRI